MKTFSEVNPISPVPTQPFIWMAEYFSGGLTELDLETGAENQFQDIAQDRLVRFGLIGRNRKTWFEYLSGTFYIAGRRIDIAFETKDGTRYSLTSRGCAREIMTCKKVVADVPAGGDRAKTGLLAPQIVAYYYGYKAQLAIAGVNFSFKPVVCLPLSQAAYLTVTTTADRDLDGRMIFLKNGQQANSFAGRLTKDKASQVNWLIT